VSDPGGRLRTDVVDGFLLDRGFAIFLTGYPEAQKVLDYDALDLQPFYAGADVHFEGAFHRLADPLRHPIVGARGLEYTARHVIQRCCVSQRIVNPCLLSFPPLGRPPAAPHSRASQRLLPTSKRHSTTT
jgi:phytoene dehydrogenase-like protein